MIMLQALTFDTWTLPMYALTDASRGAELFAIAFFVVIVVVGGLFLVNLFLAVLFQVRRAGRGLMPRAAQGGAISCYSSPMAQLPSFQRAQRVPPDTNTFAFCDARGSHASCAFACILRTACASCASLAVRSHTHVPCHTSLIRARAINPCVSSQEFVEAQAVENALAEERVRAQLKRAQEVRGHGDSADGADTAEDGSTGSGAVESGARRSEHGKSRSERGDTEEAAQPLLPGDARMSDGSVPQDGLARRTHDAAEGVARGSCDCAPAAGSWRAALGSVVNSDAFGHTSTALVLLNLVLMCMPYYGMTAAYDARLEGVASIM